MEPLKFQKALCAFKSPLSFSLSILGRSINRCLTPLFLKYIAAASDKKGGLVFEYCLHSFSLVLGKVLITTASRFLFPIA